VGAGKASHTNWVGGGLLQWLVVYNDGMIPDDDTHFFCTLGPPLLSDESGHFLRNSPPNES